MKIRQHNLLPVIVDSEGRFKKGDFKTLTIKQEGREIHLTKAGMRNLAKVLLQLSDLHIRK